MSKLLTLALLFSVVITPGCTRQFTSPEDLAQPQEVESGQPFSLKIDEEVTLTGTDLHISFPLVAEDSRCPINVNCVTTGIASVLLRVMEPDGTLSQLVLRIPGLVATPYTGNAATVHGDYRFKLLQLDPYPVSGVPTDESDYKALLLVEPR